MALHPTTFGFLNPTENQKEDMTRAREAAAEYADVLEEVLPEGPDKTDVLRMLRTVAMWANVCITRQPDGTPRDA